MNTITKLTLFVLFLVPFSRAETVKTIIVPEGYLSSDKEHKKLIKSFEIYAQPVTVGEYQSYLGNNKSFSTAATTDITLPVTNVTWYHAADYCNAHGGHLPGENEIHRLIEYSSPTTGRQDMWEWTRDWHEKDSASSVTKTLVMTSNNSVDKMFPALSSGQYSFRCVLGISTEDASPSKQTRESLINKYVHPDLSIKPYDTTPLLTKLSVNQISLKIPSGQIKLVKNPKGTNRLVFFSPKGLALKGVEASDIKYSISSDGKYAVTYKLDDKNIHINIYDADGNNLFSFNEPKHDAEYQYTNLDGFIDDTYLIMFRKTTNFNKEFDGGPMYLVSMNLKGQETQVLDFSQFIHTEGTIIDLVGNRYLHIYVDNSDSIANTEVFVVDMKHNRAFREEGKGCLSTDKTGIISGREFSSFEKGILSVGCKYTACAATCIQLLPPYILDKKSVE